MKVEVIVYTCVSLPNAGLVRCRVMLVFVAVLNRSGSRNCTKPCAVSQECSELSVIQRLCVTSPWLNLSSARQLFTPALPPI